MQKKRCTTKRAILRLTTDGASRRSDTLVAEEPLNVLFQSSDGNVQRLAATMRTPGQDIELAAGLLFSEGLIAKRVELGTLDFCVGGGPNELNRVVARLRLSEATCQERLGRRPSLSLPQSACGMCSFDELGQVNALLDWAAEQGLGNSESRVGLEDSAEAFSVLSAASERFLKVCPVFAKTGACHATMVLETTGELLGVAEDVGRHNACDKALGRLLLTDSGSERFALPPGCGLLFSSRLSFELAAKAVRAGSGFMASLGAPTDLAVRLAERCGIPCYGFVGSQRVNRY